MWTTSASIAASRTEGQVDVGVASRSWSSGRHGVRPAAAPRLPRSPRAGDYDPSISRPDLKLNGYVVAQVPNAPLLVALVAALASAFIDDGTTASDAARSIFYVALTVWAYEEAANGVNGFRRAIGVAGLVFVVVRVAQGFG